MHVLPKVMRRSLGERQVITELSQCRQLLILYLEAIQMTGLYFTFPNIDKASLYSTSMTIKEIPFYLILWHRNSPFWHTTNHLHCFSLSRRRAKQSSIFSPVALPLSQMYTNCSLSVVPQGAAGQAKGAKKWSQKTVYKIFPVFLSILCLSFPPLPLVEKRNSLLEGQMVNIYLDQRFSTSVLQEFLKCAVPDYTVRGTDLFSLRLSDKKNDNSHPV